MPFGHILEVCVIGSPVLSEKSRLIVDFDENLTELVSSMTKTMYEKHGIGIAAPQVGISSSICVVDVKPCVNKDDFCQLDNQHIRIHDVPQFVFVNPVIKKFSKKTAVMEEGCLSVPGKSGKVERSEKITIKFVDEKNVSHTLKCSGILARCIQHEIDHLNGILFTSKLIETSMPGIVQD